MSITKHIREPDLPDVSAGPANRRGLLISFDFVMIPTVIHCGGQSVRILGIDPGIATVGFGVIDAQRGSQKYVTCGVISTPAHTSLSSRLDQIYNDLVSLFDSFRPDAISVEELFFNTNITTGIAVAHGRGVILLAAYRHNIPVYEYSAQDAFFCRLRMGRYPFDLRHCVLLLSDDVELELSRDALEELQLHRGGAFLLDRGIHDYLFLIQLYLVKLVERVRDILAGDCAEEPSAFAGL